MKVFNKLVHPGFAPSSVHLGVWGMRAGPLRLNVSPLEEWREGAVPHTSDGSASLISMARL